MTPRQRRPQRVRCVGMLSTGLLALACSSDLCTLSNPALDPLAAAVDPNPQANAKLRAFFAAARALRDSAAQAEETTHLACVAIGSDLGLPSLAGHSNLEAPDALVLACDAAGVRVGQVLARAPATLSFSWSEPQCEPSAEHRGRCEALCATSVGQGVDDYCRSTCASQAATYATCTAAVVQTDGVSGILADRELVLAGATLQRNLPWLLHTQRSLLTRLQGDVASLIKMGGELPALVPEAGPQGLACLHAAMKMLVEAEHEFTVSGRGTAAILHGLSQHLLCNPSQGGCQPAQGS